MDIESVREVKNRYADLLLGKKNVVACGVGYKEVGGRKTDELCVVVSVSKKLPAEQLSPDDIVPKVLEEVKTDVQETGVIKALQARTDRWRPAPGGVSCGHIDITAGTLGCLVRREGELFILSNNHVLGNSNEGQVGDAILQPGTYDGGTSDDQIAVLEEFVPINFEPGLPTCSIAKGLERFLNAAAKAIDSSHRFTAYRVNVEANLVDAAIARPLSDDLVEKRILEIGEPHGAIEGALGMKIRKSGRTTEVTEGEITQVDVTVQVQYGAAKIATFTDQLMAGAMSSGGDSGSVVLDENGYVAGLLFAGSETTTVMNTIQNVLQSLNVTIDP